MLTQDAAMNVLVFGDLAADVHPFLYELFMQRDLPCLLASFLNRTTSVLRADISQLPNLERQNIPPLTDFPTFLTTYKSLKTRNPAVDNALLTIAQLSHWIG